MRIGALGEVFIARSGEKEFTPVKVHHGQTVAGVNDTGFARAFMEFAPLIVDAIREGRSSIPHAATFTDGLRVQRVLDAARESNSKSRVVTL